MRHIWSLICHRSIIDKKNNLISIIDSIEQLTIPITEKGKKEKKKILQIDIQVVSFIVKSIKSINKSELLIEFIDPADKKLSDLKVQFEIPEGYKRTRVVTGINQLFLTSEGQYKLRIKMKETPKGQFKKQVDIPLDIVYKNIEKKKMTITEKAKKRK